MRTLILTPVPSHPVQGGGWTARLNHLVEALEEIGQEVDYAYIPNVIKPADMTSMTKHWGKHLHVLPLPALPSLIAQRPVGVRIFDRCLHQIEYRISYANEKAKTRLFGRWDTWYNRKIHRYLLELQRERKYNAVIIQYGLFSKAFQAFGENVLRLLDTNDLCVGRHELMQRFGLTSKWSTTKKEETRHLNRANGILAITDEEGQLFSYLSQRQVYIVGHLAPVTLSQISPARRMEALFVGGDNKMNQHAAKFLIHEILPLLRARVPDARILFAGDICRFLLPAEGLILLGKVENLQPVYEQVTLVVNPMFAGTGLAIKTIEALSYGKPVVATRMGARGLLQGVGTCIFVADHPDEFASAMARIMQSPQLAADLGVAAHCFAAKYRKRMIENLYTCFNGIGAP